MAKHPLSRLTADEIMAARTILVDRGFVTPDTRFAYLGLVEPPVPATDHHRRVRALLLDSSTGAALDAVVSLTAGVTESATVLDPRRDGQPPIMLGDILLVDEIVKADAGWVAAMARRGLTDLDLIRPCPLSAGSFAGPGEEGRRLLRVLSFAQHRPDDHPWAHPIDGVVAHVDPIERRVVELVDDVLLPVPADEANHDDPAYVGPARTGLRPIVVSQPDGPSFTVVDDEVTWQGWRLRIGFDAREGLVLHGISLHDRPIVRRASVAEMVVPYADPSPARFWQSYFDTGEYLLGQQVTSLAPGCDCLGEIVYLDAVLPAEDGSARHVPHAICLHEEDAGIGWKHTDLFTGSAVTRRQRRLVVSCFVAIGPYDYGFYWYLYLDGRIELEVKATGVVFTSAYRDGSPWAAEVAPGLGAPYHQHLFNARLDLTVDGLLNAVDEVRIAHVPMGPDNPHGNAFTREVTRLTTEGPRHADPAAGLHWLVVNPTVTNRVGRPVGYALHPQGSPLLAADPASSVARRAAFATADLWVTAYHPGERYSAGDLPNQHPGGAGLPAYVSAGRDIDGADLVLWHTFGLTHFPRTEDWPVMPVTSCGFTLRPVGFFDRNPILDLPG